MIVDAVTGAALDPVADLGSYVRAILNILADFGEEKTRLADIQRAMLNILEDSGAEKLRLEAAQKATLNILADFGEEKTRLADIQRAMLNILEDSGVEKLRLEAAQKATLNILADFGDERAKLADVQKAVLNILEDFAGEKARLEATQKAVLNILDDFDAEKNRVEQLNREMLREIGERKQAEESLEAANKELEAFSYTVSHDLRAPLRAIDGFSRILLEKYGTQLPADAQRYQRLVRDNTQQMGRLIDDLLTFSRLSRQPLRKQQVAPADLVQKVLADLRGEQGGRRIEINIRELPACEADPALLTQVFVNLLSNALKYTRKREVARIEVGYFPHLSLPFASGGRRGASEDAYYVRDNGVGFDMQYVDKLFGVFQRLHRAEEYEGTGVGLAIVQRIIHRHGGRVWAESEPDNGATFYFTI